MTLRRILPGLVLAVCTISIGCGNCTLIGCVNGFWVIVQAAPALPYKIEVFKPTGAGLTLLKSTECTTENCYGGVHVDDTTLTHVAVRVTSPAGTRETDFPNVTYSESYPNGRSCGPNCISAQVVALVP